MTFHERLKPGRYRLTIEDYERLEDAGAFGDARTELIDGQIWIVSPAHTRHARLHLRFGYLIEAALEAIGSPLVGYTAPSISMFEDTRVEPDLVIAEDQDEGRLALASVRLAIEVSDSTAARDLRVKAPLYARAGVPKYWRIDVRAAQVHQLWAPAAGTYREEARVPFGELLRARTIDGLEIDTGRF